MPAKAAIGGTSTAAAPGTPAAASPATAPSAAAGGSASTGTPSRPGVVADCIKAPATLRARPATITIACADNGIGVRDMTWTAWTSSGATGAGRLWEKLCKPNCAEGKIGVYPVRVRLSAVKTSSYGSWFSKLTLTWEGSHPSYTPATLSLPAPLAPAG